MSTDPQAAVARSGHESRDADVFFILLTAFGLLVALVFISIAIWVALHHFRSQRPPVSSVSLSAATARFPQPQLQANPALDLAEMRARDARELNSYGWVDRKAGVSRVPIDRAMQLLLKRGLPDVGQNQTPLSLMQARPAAGETPRPSPQPKS